MVIHRISNDPNVPSYSRIDLVIVQGRGDTRYKLLAMFRGYKETTYFAGLDRSLSKSLLLIGGVEGF